MLKFDTTKIDLGTLPFGTGKEFTFSGINPTTQTVTATIQGSCGCMALDASLSVEPGQRFTMPSKLTKRNHAGTFPKTITVTYYDESTQVLNLMYSVAEEVLD